MRNHIYWKFFKGYIIFCLIGFLFIALVGTKITYHSCEKDYIASMYRVASQISSSYNNPSMETIRKDGEMEELLIYMKAVLPLSQYMIWIMDPDGNILYRSTDSSFLTTPIATDFDPTDSESGYFFIGNFYHMFDQKTISVFAPLTRNFQTDAYILLHLPVSVVVSEADHLQAVSYQTFAFLLILALVLLIFMTLSVYRPLRKIVKAADEYASGNLLYDAGISTHDEMGHLSATLAYMAKRLHDTTEDQHKFVANVSHDFRSPLTSIKGYIEAMADGTIPESMFPRYFHIVLDETSRLTKLTQSLLTLNSYDSQSTYLDTKDFDIHQTIKQVLATFEGRCMEKRISFDLIYPSRELYVFADLDKIQQVLYNLIDNAIKFSNPDSSIRIETYVNHDKVYISIKDEGVGIPANSINKIWDRFYKTDSSRGRDRKGTGLGLSIVKEIIAAHNERIDVISTEGAGTKFIFTLPCSSSHDSRQST